MVSVLSERCMVRRVVLRSTDGRPYLAVSVAVLIAYATIIHWTFQTEIAPVFNYLGARYRSPDLANYCFVGLALLLSCIVLPGRIDTPADLVLWVLFIVVGVPAALVPQYSDIIPVPDSLRLGLIVAAAFLAMGLAVHARPFFCSIRISLPPQLIWACLAGISLITYTLVAATFGLSFVNFSFESARDIRLVYRTETAGGGVLGYLVRYQGSVINPFLVATGVLRRQWITLVAPAAVGQLILFGATGYKLFFFSVPVLIALTWLFATRRKITGQGVVGAVVLASLVAIIVDKLRGGPIYWIEIFVDRFLIIPGMLTAAYVQVYDDRPKHAWVYAGLNPFSQDPYHGTPPGFVVAADFSGNAQANANANFLADGYANLGYIGLAVGVVVVVLILWGVNATCSHVQLSVAAPVLLLPTLTLANGSAFIAILTGGFLLACLLLASLPADWGADAQAPRASS